MNVAYIYIYAYRLQTKVYLSLLGDISQEAMHVLLPKVLLQVSVCSSWHLRQQASVPLLQQLEDPARRTQMPLKLYILSTFVISQLRSMLCYCVALMAAI
jgi:hypothetical protein